MADARPHLPASGTKPYGARVHWSVTIAGQRWSVTWSPQDTAPRGENHGSSGICLTGNGIVLVSRDGHRWEFPAGRPEGDERLLDTLRREVREEACCEVETADLLGFTTSRCLEGPEAGLELVRAHWAAHARATPWRPDHETVQRMEVRVADVMSTLTIEPGLEPAYEQIWAQARQVLGCTGRR